MGMQCAKVLKSHGFNKTLIENENEVKVRKVQRKNTPPPQNILRVQKENGTTF